MPLPNATSNALQWTATNNPKAEEPGPGFIQNEITWIQNIGPYVGLRAMEYLGEIMSQLEIV